MRYFQLTLHLTKEDDNIFFVIKLNLTKASFFWQKVVSWKPLSKFSYVCFSLEKLINGKHFLVKRKFGLVSRKLFFFYFGRKTLSRSWEKFRNIILFVDYNKFGPQTFDCYIFCFEFFFQFHPLEFDFYINFDPHFYDCYFLFSYYFFN